MLLTFYKDFHWHIAIFLGFVFWSVYGILIDAYPLQDYLIPVKVFIFSVVLYPVVEEIVFRGFVQEYLNKLIALNKGMCGLSVANLITSTLFALFHVFNQEIGWALLIFFPSLVFGYFKDRYGRVLPSILLHSFYNWGFFILIY